MLSQSPRRQGSHHDLKAALASALDGVRRRTLDLVGDLSDDDLAWQSSRLLSPPAWDLGHVAAYEELWLVRRLDEAGRSSALSEVYDPFEHARSSRGDLPLPNRATLLGRLEEVRARSLETLHAIDFDRGDALVRDGFVYRLVTQHEAQHQETLLQCMNLRRTPYGPAAGRVATPPGPRVDDEERVVIPGGPFDLGTDDASCTFDNERPRHRRDVPTFAIDRHPVTNRRWLSFMQDGGYDRPELWTADGWKWRQVEDAHAPLCWERSGDEWQIRRFGHVVEVNHAEPVQHVSHHEATAFARWAGGRLPTEVEWEKAAAWDPSRERSLRHPWGDDADTKVTADVQRRSFAPAPVGRRASYASPAGVEDLLGGVYEWTASDFQPHPGFLPFPYREYSEVFFGDRYKVLRGASWAIDRACVRNTYRNWDLPNRRQIFAGVRLAWDA